MAHLKFGAVGKEFISLFGCTDLWIILVLWVGFLLVCFFVKRLQKPFEMLSNCNKSCFSVTCTGTEMQQKQHQCFFCLRIFCYCWSDLLIFQIVYISFKLVLVFVYCIIVLEAFKTVTTRWKQRTKMGITSFTLLYFSFINILICIWVHCDSCNWEADFKTESDFQQ